MCEITIKVTCIHCKNLKVKKNGKKPSGKQNFLCNACGKQFQIEYIYKGADPKNKGLIRSMSVNGSGIRDTSRVLNVSILVVLRTLRKWFSTIEEPKLKGHYKRVEIDEFWSWVGHRKRGKRWVWYAFCPQSKKILAFQIGKRNAKTCKKLLRKLAHLEIDVYCTDNWKAYKEHIPSQNHIISKKKTTYI
ncbi:MAG: IS1 family transposase [Aureispira sp.]|nr:IS1 family transposase [Aureispira sp.]